MEKVSSQVDRALKNILLLCFIFTNSYSQLLLQKQDVAGVWVCKHVSLSDKEPMTPEIKAMTEKIKDGFIAGKFTFGANGIFKLQLPKAGPELSSLVDMANNKTWVLNNNRVSISPRENIMHFDITRGNGVLVFSLYETPFILTMEKIQP